MLSFFLFVICVAVILHWFFHWAGEYKKHTAKRKERKRMRDQILREKQTKLFQPNWLCAILIHYLLDRIY